MARDLDSLVLWGFVGLNIESQCLDCSTTVLGYITLNCMRTVKETRVHLFFNMGSQLGC